MLWKKEHCSDNCLLLTTLYMPVSFLLHHWHFHSEVVVCHWTGVPCFNLCMPLYIVFLPQFSKSFIAHYWVTKMGADFASLRQKMFITLIILQKIMFQQVQAVCRTWHMCELAVSHHSYNIITTNKTKGKTLGGRLHINLVAQLWKAIFVKPGDKRNHYACFWKLLPIVEGDRALKHFCNQVLVQLSACWLFNMNTFPMTLQGCFIKPQIVL